MRSRRSFAAVAAVLLGTSLQASPAGADPGGHVAGEGLGGVGSGDGLVSDDVTSFSEDPALALAQLEATHNGAPVTQKANGAPGSFDAGKKHKRHRGAELDLVGRGRRLEAQATTDVWSHENFAYTGTFDSPCGGEPDAGVWVWDTHSKRRPRKVGVIASPEGSRTNDVKVDGMSSGDILVHSNEVCGEGGVGGFEIYNVDDPTAPVHLAHVQTDDVNVFLQEELGYVDFGVHNLFLFQRNGRDYVAAMVESLCGTFQVFDITDPTEPALAGFWGAEQIRLAELGLDDATCADFGVDEIEVLIDLEAYLLTGFGGSPHKLLHDITISADGADAYLSNWDAGLVLLDISDPTVPDLVSVARDIENGSLDGEVNSHSAWPSEDGTIVVEGEEDFTAWFEHQVVPTSLTFGEDPANPAPLPGTAVSTVSGDALEGSQTGNEVTVDGSSVVVDAGPLAGEVFEAAELAGDQPMFADVGPLSGEAVWIGQACDGDEILNADAIDPGDIAVVRRGECSFRIKNFNAGEAGAAAVVLANNAAPTPWSGLRIWDYSDPANPVLASTYNTACSAAAEPIPGCDPEGTYSSHNVVVETVGKRVLAYVSWYWDGMIVLDVTDPYNPKQVAQFFKESPRFIEKNGGNPHDFWGVWKEPGRPWIYGSDRNGGLYVFRLSGRRG